MVLGRFACRSRPANYNLNIDTLHLSHNIPGDRQLPGRVTTTTFHHSSSHPPRHHPVDLLHIAP